MSIVPAVQPQRQRVTLSRIAREAKVSLPVVSMVLNGRTGRVGASAATRERVMEAASRLGYRVNAAAVALREGCFRSVGVLFASSHAAAGTFYLPTGVLAGISRALESHRYGLTLVCLPDLTLDAISRQGILGSYAVDAMIVGCVGVIPPAMSELVAGSRVPAIWMYQDYATDAVRCDESGGAAILVKHMASRGHRHITLMDFNGILDSQPHASQRRDGFVGQCAREKVAGSLWSRKVDRMDRAAVCRELLSGKRRPHAVIVESCSAAQVLLDVALTMGLRVPQDLAIATFDNGTSWNANAPTLTSAIVPEESLGFAAAEMCLARVAGQPAEKRLIECELRIGGST